MPTFVLVPGACHGGWWYDDLVAELEARGHTAHAVTLLGLGADDDAEGREAITLLDHIGQAAGAVEAALEGEAGSEGREQEEEVADEGVVLVGHSYAGMVITGVADRMPGAVRALVYLDAFVPDDGDSCYSLTNDEQRAWYIGGSGRTGVAVDPLSFFDERARPQPLATLVQKARLTGTWRSVPMKLFAAAEWPGESPFATSIARVESDPGFTVEHWPTRHNVLHDGPARVLEALLAL